MQIASCFILFIFSIIVRGLFAVIGFIMSQLKKESKTVGQMKPKDDWNLVCETNFLSKIVVSKYHLLYSFFKNNE